MNERQRLTTADSERSSSTNMSFRLGLLEDADALLELAREADSEGARFVSRLVTDWRDGSNRFDRPGERVFTAAVDGRIVGVCGLNVDPYIDEASVGRVRHLYVAPAFRRRGIGSLLVDAVVREAHSAFNRLRLRTNNPEAAGFYEAIGFQRVEYDEACTHQLLLTVA